MNITTLADLDDAAFGAAFTAVYAGYPLPMAMDAAGARRHIVHYAIDRAHSPLWLDDDRGVIALAALGVRGARGWVGGFGVVPSYRGRGLSHRLMAETLAQARILGLRAVQLEVLTTNTRAIRAYERAGFVRVRDLRIFASPAPPLESEGDLAGVADADPAALLPHRARITPVRPVWQREPEAVARMEGLRGLALGVPDAPAAYLIYRAGVAAVQIVDIVVPDGGAVSLLLAALAARHPDLPMRLGNEPEKSSVCATLDALGWMEPLRQHEMICNLWDAPS